MRSPVDHKSMAQNITEECFVALLNERDVAQRMSISLASVRRWRLLSQGPRFFKIGASVRYRPGDVDTWLASRPSGGERRKA